MVQGLETNDAIREDIEANTDIVEEFLRNAQGIFAISADVQDLKVRITDLELATIRKVDGAYVTEDGFLYLTSNNEDVVGPLGPFSGGGGGGGGGGGSTTNAKFTATNSSGWMSKTIASDSECIASITWSSIEDEIPTGPGRLAIAVNGAAPAVLQVDQGIVHIDLAKYCNTGLNSCILTLTDIYSNKKTFAFSIMVTSISLSSSFDTSVPYTGRIPFPYTPVGSLPKTVHFILDGTEIGTQETSVTNNQVTYQIPAQAHGGHSLRVYFDCEINGEPVRSNELYFEFISIEEGNNTVIITSSFGLTQVQQYSTVTIPYRVYDPQNDKRRVYLYVNDELVSSPEVDRSEASYSYRALEAGDVVFKISAGEGTTPKVISFHVNEVNVNVQAETEDLVLYLNTQGRSNNEETRDIWRYENPATHETITAQLQNFNWALNGWQTDDDGIVVMRLSDDARITIPYQIFESDFKSTGKTIEIEFATRQVADYNATILNCMSDNVGLKITPQSVEFRGAQSSLSTLYKDNEHVRLTIVVEKQTENRLILMYINGIMSRAIQYASGERFSQRNPVSISIGSNDCGTDIYAIRVYDNSLNRRQVLDNWIADTQVGDLMVERYQRNQVYNDAGEIVAANLPSNLPYFVLNAKELPQYKGDKKTISGSYTDSANTARSFTFEGDQINVQGTSSAIYYRKNYDMQFKNGFEMSNGQHADSYALRNDSINVPFNRFVLKADVASSEGANNVELVRMFCDVSPFKKREALVDPRIRQGIDGFPIVVFWHDTVSGNTTFLGKYNFNLPKRAPGPYGYSGDMESWEFQNNTSELMLFQTDYFDETPYTDPDTGDTKELWRYDYEARFPSDEWTNYLKLQELQSFVYSTYREEATGDPIAPVTYDGVEYTTDSADYRLAKFKAKFGDYAEVNSFIFYYIFTELFLMVDSRAKNLFIGFSGSDTDPNLHLTIDRKAVAEPYDMDTALGTNNEGSLVFGFSLEDTDHLAGGANVFNGQDSVLWNNLRDAFGTEIRQMYQQLRSASTLSYTTVENRYEQHQSKWPEAIWIEDAWFKYIDPLIAPDPGKQPTGVYLPMMQGSKAEQRKWWLYNRFRYMDSKWNAGDALSQVIQLRGYEVADITVTPYADIYPTIKYASYVVQERGTHDVPTTLECPLSTLDDTEIYIYSAPQLSSVGDLSPLKVGFADFSWATRLDSIKLGDSSLMYENLNLKTLSLWNVDQGQSNKLIRTLDVRNCNALGTDQQKNIDLRGAPNIEYVYADGTAITSCDLPNGGNLKVLQLPATITNLTVLNQPGLTTFYMPNFTNLTQLRIENSGDEIPVANAVASMAANSRVRIVGLNLTVSSMSEVDAFYAKLDTMRGLDENGGYTDHAVVSGTIHGLTGVSPSWLAAKQAQYPNVTIEYEYFICTLNYYNYDGTVLLHSEELNPGEDGAWDGAPTREQDAQYTYAFAGWALTTDASASDPNATKNVTTDRNVYAAYTRFVKTYTVTWKNDNGNVLETDLGVTYGTTPTYNGSTPSSALHSGWDFVGWTPAVGPITGDTIYTATYVQMFRARFYNGSTLLQTLAKVPAGTTPEYTGATPTSPEEGFVFDHWQPTPGPISANTDYYAQFRDTNTPLRQYLAGTIKEYSSSSVSKIAQCAFYSRTQLTSVEAAATLIEGNAFQACQALNVVDLTHTTAQVTIQASAFASLGTLAHLIIRSEVVASLASTNALSGTKIAAGAGAIYVPADLVDTYKAATNWSTYASQIYPISAYPKTDFSTISDSWDTILANANYATDYSIGDTKLLDLGNKGEVYMEIVAINEDDKADNSGKAGLTWVSRPILETHRMNVHSITSGGWESSEMRAYLKDTIKPLIPQNVRNGIVSVTKVSSIFEDGALVKDGQTTTDDVWIMSGHEVFGTDNYETIGAVYTTKFKDRSSRVKRNLQGGGGGYWWLRSTVNASRYLMVGSSGESYGDEADRNNFGLVFGFCTNNL